MDREQQDQALLFPETNQDTFCLDVKEWNGLQTKIPDPDKRIGQEIIKHPSRGDPTFRNPGKNRDLYKGTEKLRI